MAYRLLYIFSFLFYSLSGQSQNESKTFTPVLEFYPSSDLWLNTIEIESDNSRTIDFIGISGYESIGSTGGKFKYRYSTNSLWSDWSYFNYTTDNLDRHRRPFEGLPILGSIDKLQIASERQQEVTIRLFISYQSDKESIHTADYARSNCSCEFPIICNRDCWCPDGDCAPVQSPLPTIPSHIIVHHSAGFNTSDNFANVVAYYYDLHVNTNGWDDIGYNWLIDANGIIYEGRGDAAQGAHFSCMNGNTTGICMIGNFMETTPTFLAMNSLESLMSWELCDKGLDPTEVTWHEPSQLNLQTISGHRDGNPSTSSQSCASGTVCPGDMLYGVLDIVRNNIADNSCLDLNTGIEDDELTELSIYPNPVIDILRIDYGILEMEAVNINIINALSETVYSEKMESHSKVGSLRLNHLTSGIYYLLIDTRSRRYSQMFIKK